MKTSIPIISAFLVFLIVISISVDLREATFDILKITQDTLREIPSQFWATFAGSVFTLAGVWATNHYTDKRTDRTLEHDREQKKLDRSMSLRREVYLAAADAISSGMQSLPRFSDPYITDAEISRDYTEKSSALARVQIIAGTEVCAAILEIMRALISGLLDIAPDRGALLHTQAMLNDHEKNLEAHRQTRKWAEQGLLASYTEGLRDSIKAHTDLIDMADEAIAKEGKAVSEAREELNRIRLRTLLKGIKKLREIDMLVPSAYLAVRKELSLEVDAEKFKILLEDHSRLVSAQLLRTIEQVNADTA